MRLLLATLVLTAIACSPDNRLADAPPRQDSPVEGPKPADACVGLECQVAPCTAQGQPTTTITGTVYAPNGTLPLYGVTVYVPAYEPGPLADGVQCVNCESKLPGKPVALGLTNELGRFTVESVPVGTDIPLIITIGKWRRRLTLPTVTACVDNPIDPELTRLPRNQSEGDIPKMAMVAGGCDALECLVRKLGIDDSEFTSDTGTGRIHLYRGEGGTSGLGDGTQFAPASTLWGDLPKLKQYDIGLFSCECGENPAQKSQASVNNIKAYADAGGRLFLSHYHYFWIVGDSTHTVPVWPTIATCDIGGSSSGNMVIDTVHNKKGTSFSLWMEQVMGSPFPGIIPVTEGRQSCSDVSNEKGERWVYYPTAGKEYPQNFQFTTPNELPSNARCGKVVFSDMHVASGSTSRTPFPSGCSSDPMTPQEKALSFMFFDIAGCVGIIQ